jgi:anti-anti-sigma factor
VTNPAPAAQDADTAADAAALAGADALALGRGSSAAVRAARAAASLNHARLVSCSCAGAAAEVVVQLGRAYGRARAVVDLSGVSYMDSSGLGTLVTLYISAKKAGKTFKLLKMSDRVAELLRIGKLASIFDGYGQYP